MVAEGTYQNRKIIIAQPTTYMNLSGQAVQALLSWYKVAPENLIVLYDDVDLEIGEVRIRPKGSSGGHHGIESIVQDIGTQDFNRVRIGIGRDKAYGDVSSYVLGKIPPSEREPLAAAVQVASDAALAIAVDGVQLAMNKFNA